MKKLLLLMPAALLMISCASGNCRSQREKDAKEQHESLMGKTQPSATVKVFKYDGSLQCGMGQPIDLAKMQKQLTGIKVISSYKRPDGLMHIQVCGSGTGLANVYEIERADLSKALKFGFKEWTFE